MFSYVQRQIEGEFSGERARELTEAIHSFDRWSTFSQYRLCGNYCATRMREYRLEEVELMEIPADGETKFGDWTMPLAWDVEEAGLELIEPREAARMLNKLIGEGRFPRPKRSIRFMMSWECYGSIPWCVERIYEKRNVVAGLCLDDLGGKREITAGQITLVLNPHCQASFTDFLASELAGRCFREEEGFACKVSPWMGGTDNTIFQDPAFGVPMPWLTEHPARFHHTSLDVIDNIDAESLRREGIFAATYLYFVANAGEADIPRLARGTRELWEGRIEEVRKEFMAGLAAKEGAEELSSAWQEVQERIEYLVERGVAAIRSTGRLSGDGEAQQAIDEEVKRLEREKSYALQELEQAARRRVEAKGWVLGEAGKQPQSKEGADLIPRRLLPGLLTLCTIPAEERSEYDRVTRGENPMWLPVLIFGLFWADGRRDLREIQRLVELELGPTEIDLVAYFRFLERLGLVECV